MPNDKELAPLKGELVASDTLADGRFDEAITKIAQLIQVAVASLQLQNAQEAASAARTAEALYDAAKQYVSEEELLILGIFKNHVSIFAPLTRAIVFQVEGRFAKAREEFAKGLETCDQTIAAIERYARLPNANQDLVHNVRPIFSVMPALLRGSDASIRAEMVGYQGDIPQYRKLLREAVTEFRKAERLPSSLNPTFLALVSFCASLAERFETRIEVFGAELGPRYLSPTGDKVFIIHGHDEAKWRELRELLEDRLHLKGNVVVLKEEPGVGETLIRKFEEFAHNCCYAFALLTPDDFIDKEGKKYFQARPNVLFELG